MEPESIDGHYYLGLVHAEEKNIDEAVLAFEKAIELEPLNQRYYYNLGLILQQNGRSDEAEQVFQDSGLDAFARSEASQAQAPLGGGPFKAFLSALHQLQQEFPEGQSPIRTALVTARGAPAHERVIRTLRAWDIRLDESLFLGGMEKTEFLRAFDADIFFDDHPSHCELAADHVATGHVPHGVTNN